MDPITIVASCIAIAQALDRIATLISKFGILLEAQNEYKNLLNETQSLRSFLASVRPIFVAFEREELGAQQILLFSETLLNRIEDLIHTRLSKQGRNDPQVQRLAWLQKRREVTRLHTQLRDTIPKLCLSLHGIMISTQMQMKAELAQVTGLVAASAKNIIDKQDASCQAALDGIPTTPALSWNKDSSDIKRGSHSIVWNSENTEPNHRGYISVKTCTSRYHRRTLTVLESPKLRSYTGSIIIGTVGNIISTQSTVCDDPKCGAKSTCQLLIVWNPPRWLLAHAFGLVFRSGPSPSVTLHFPRVIPPDAAIAIAIRRGDCDHIRRLISDGEASPLDIVGPYGLSALQLAISYGSFGAADLLMSMGAHRYNAPIPSRVGDVAQFWTTFNLVRCSLPGSEVIKDLFHLCAIDKYLELVQSSSSRLLEVSDSLPRLHKSVLGLTLEDSEHVVRESRSCINKVDSLGRTALHWAVCQNNETSTEGLLRCGADPDVHDQDQRTPLHLAAALGHSRIVELLISAGADLMAGDAILNTPMHVASMNNHSSIVSLLAQAGGNIEFSNGLGETPLLSACLNNSVDSISVLHSFGANLEQKCVWGCSALGRGIKVNRHETVSLLLELGARADTVRHDYRTILHMIAQASDSRMIRLLIDANVCGFDVDARDGDGMTASQHLQLRKDVEDLSEPFQALCEQAMSRTCGAENTEEEFFDACETFTIGTIERCGAISLLANESENPCTALRDPIRQTKDLALSPLAAVAREKASWSYQGLYEVLDINAPRRRGYITLYRVRDHDEEAYNRTDARCNPHGQAKTEHGPQEKPATINFFDYNPLWPSLSEEEGNMWLKKLKPCAISATLGVIPYAPYQDAYYKDSIAFVKLEDDVIVTPDLDEKSLKKSGITLKRKIKGAHGINFEAREEVVSVILELIGLFTK